MAGAPRGGLGTRTVSLLNQGSRPGERLRGCGAWRGAWGGTWGFRSGGRGRGPARHLTEGLAWSSPSAFLNFIWNQKGPRPAKQC